MQMLLRRLRWLLVQNHAQQRAMDFEIAIVLNETQVAKLVHKLIHAAGSNCVPLVVLAGALRLAISALCISAVGFSRGSDRYEH
jgi:hypothetical protein